jgi:ribosomal protein S27AE
MMSSSSFQDPFRSRIGVLATMHQKEQVMAPLLEDRLGVQIVVPQAFNTDEFGTFTRDIKRSGDQLNAARLKTKKALSLTGLTLAFASEGSFGPHPSIPFLPCNLEMVLLSDRNHDLEIVGQAISTETNYASRQVTRLEEAIAFAQTIGFPDHALIAMSDPESVVSSSIFKGIRDETQLVETVDWFLKKFGKAHLETDMRAMHNPTRMKVIAEATHDLIQKINQRCPECGFPGFSPAEYKAGLPCGLCGRPTELTLSVIHYCKRCNTSRIEYFPNGQEFADPAQCLFCNP